MIAIALDISGTSCSSVGVCKISSSSLSSSDLKTPANATKCLGFSFANFCTFAKRLLKISSSLSVFLKSGISRGKILSGLLICSTLCNKNMLPKVLQISPHSPLRESYISLSTSVITSS
eukprot:NODE_14_length_42432_cov_0.433799.p23 type:complete len:119 gc:universal NODE_14_length_42432_cov_0.433799:20879-20523(-)